MKILIISVVFPYPIDAGGSAGTHKLIDYSRKNHEITLVTPYASPENKEQLQHLWPEVKLVTVADPPQEDKQSLARRVFNFLKPGKAETFEQRNRKNMQLFTTDFVNCYFGDIILLVNEELKKTKFDLIQVEYIEFAPFIYFLPEDIPNVFIHHELRYKRMELEYKTLNAPSDAMEWRLKATRELEIALLNRYDRVLTVSDQDAVYLAEDGVKKDKLVVSPSSVEMVRKKINVPFTFKNRVLYLGPEKHYPNLDAVEWFLANCWEKISQENPLLEFHIIGKWTEEYQLRYKNLKNVRFLGFVKDLEQAMEGSVMIVPLRIVSGMRMKILEAVSWNVPVVSTSAGAEGLPMVHQENCLLADSAEEFIDAVNRISTDSALQNRLIKNSENLVLDKYSKENCGKIREACYHSLLEEQHVVR